MNEHRLAGFELGLIEQSLPCRHGNDRNGGRFDVGERGWLARDHRRRSQGIFGIGPDEPRIRDAINLISDAQVGDVWPDRLDVTGQVGAQGEGERLRKGAPSGPDPTIPWANSGGADFDKDFAGAGTGHGNALELHCFWRAELMYAPGHHRRVDLVPCLFTRDAVCRHRMLLASVASWQISRALRLKLRRAAWRGS